MNGDDPLDDKDEKELRDALRASDAMTSAEHDDAILAAAREAAAEHARRRARRARLVPALAAAALAVVAIGLVTFTQLRPMDDTVRGDDAGLVVPPSGARLDSAPDELAWPAQPGATAYRVVLRDASAVVLWRGPESAANRLTLPTDGRRALDRAGTYLWTVEVDGGARGELGPYWFEIAAR